MAFSLEDVAVWDVDSVAGWLNLIKCKDCIEPFVENEINGVSLLEMDEETLDEYGIETEQKKILLTAIATLKATPTSPTHEDEQEYEDSDDDGYANPQDAIKGNAPSGSSNTPAASNIQKAGANTAIKIGKNKKKDPLRIAAKARSVADLEVSTVTSGYLWKVGGSGLKIKHWKKRFFVLTDDNCLYYFKSQKEMSALGMIMLPSYTITVADKNDNVGQREFAWKAFNRLRDGDRQYVFAAETAAEMKQWMNVMSLASIAFGSGKASMQKNTQSARLAGDQELDTLMKKAPQRVGGVTGGDEPITNVVSNPNAQQTTMPSHLQKTGKTKGRTLCLIKMLDGDQLQLYAEEKTIGQEFLLQVCTLLGAYERYYFGLSYIDKKGDQQWLAMDKKVVKHEFRKEKGVEHIDLQLEIRFYPMDVTQVMQYVTLYQAFLSARRDVVTEKLNVTGKDAMLLAALSMQALRGDYDPSKNPKSSIVPSDIIPARTMREARIPPNIPGDKLNDFWKEELCRCWVKMAGILKHLAVLKYMQIVQKHRLYAMSFVDVKNKKGTPLTLGVSPHGLFVYRLNRVTQAVVKFSWAECSELSFTEKKFTIQVHDKNTKAFSVYCTRAKVCQRILRLCVGLHQLYVQTVRQWANPPSELAQMRQMAIKAALKEREELQKIAQDAMVAAAEKKRAEVKSENKAQETPRERKATIHFPRKSTTPTESPTPAGNDGVVVEGRDKAVKLMDMMMDDEEFMRMQDELLQGMEESIGDGYDMVGDDEVEAEESMRDRCASELIGDRVQYMERLEHNN